MKNSLAVKFTATSRGKAGIRRWEVGRETTAAPHPETGQQIIPVRCTDLGPRTRPQARRGCSYQAPPAGQGLRSPGSRHRSEPPPGWAPPGPPAKVQLPLTSLGGEDRASPRAAAAALRPDAHRKSGPRNQAAETAAPTTERAPRLPSLSAPREAVTAAALPPSAPLPLYFLQPTPLLLQAARHSCRRHRVFAAPQATL